MEKSFAVEWQGCKSKKSPRRRDRLSKIHMPIEAQAKGKVISIPQVGGLHHRYRRAA
jgi:hypothetical protein